MHIFSYTFPVEDVLFPWNEKEILSFTSGHFTFKVSNSEPVVLCFSAEGAANNKCIFIVVKIYLSSEALFIFVRRSNLFQIGNFHTFCNTVYLLQLNHSKLPLPNKTFLPVVVGSLSVTKHFGPHCKCLFLLHFIYIRSHIQPLYTVGIMCIIQLVCW